ncbi:MAG: tRNA (N6-isopentenyl adenosine(37)-C2)-methylthiotransferase MiaB [bacterium]
MNDTSQITTTGGSHSVARRKVHIETWGCQMNVADSERMLALLEAQNYELTKSGPEAADLILLNTCHIREKARHKVLSRLGVLDELKQKNPELKIAVTGCVAQADGKKLLELAPQIDVLLGPGKIEELPNLLSESTRLGTQTMATGFDRHRDAAEAGRTQPNNAESINIPSVSGKKEVTRFVNIIQGCNNFCTFCVVPFTRGREISRPIEDIRKEVQYLVSQGAREVTLLGQNVNSYGLDFLETEDVPADGGPFVDLLKVIGEIDGLERLRFTTSNPHDFTRPLADLFASQPKLGRYMHLPVQAGNNRTLERMKRKVTVEQYLERIYWLQTAVPGIAISTDIIVGFPGETDEEFEDTLRLMERIRFSFVYAFKYSPRRGTAAARFSDQIPEAVKDTRLARLNALQDKISLELALADVGRTKDVLFIYESQKSPGIWVGKTPEFRTVRVNSKDDLLGRTLPVHVTGGNKIALLGELIHG